MKNKIITTLIMTLVLSIPCFAQVSGVVDCKTGQITITPLTQAQIDEIKSTQAAKQSDITNRITPFKTVYTTLQTKTVKFLTDQGVTGITDENLKFKAMKWVNDQLINMPSDADGKIATLTNCVQILNSVLAMDQAQRMININSN